MKKLVFLFIIGISTLACNDREIDLESSITVPVSVEEIKPQSIEQFIETTGTVEAIKKVELTAETNGYYRRGKAGDGTPFSVGDPVDKDDVIVYLDNPELENEIMIESKELELDISEREFEKQQSLYEKGGVTLRELKNAEQAFINAQYNYENAQLQLAKIKVRSPFDGLIVDLPYFTEGTRVQSGAVIANVMNYEELYMDVNIPGKQLGRVSVGQRARVLNYTMPDDTLWGEITQVSPAIDPETRTFLASIIVDNPDLTFRPGMFVKNEIIVARHDSVIVVPKDIIIQSRGSKRVFVVERGAADERRIETGLENPTHVEIVDGLDEGERLVVKGYETLSDRTKVKIVR